MSHSTEGPTCRLNDVSIRCVENNNHGRSESMDCMCMYDVCLFICDGCTFQIRSYFMCATGILGGSHVLIMGDSEGIDKMEK